MVFNVYNVETAVGCHGDVSWPIELPVSRARLVVSLAPLSNKKTIDVELLDAVVEMVCNVETAVGCHGDTLRRLELPVSRAPRAVAVILAPLSIEITIDVELLDAVVFIV